MIDTVESSKISTILENKTLSNTSISGTLSLNNTDGTTVTGLSGDYQIGDKMLKIINEIIVSIT